MNPLWIGAFHLAQKQYLAHDTHVVLAVSNITESVWFLGMTGRSEFLLKSTASDRGHADIFGGGTRSPPLLEASHVRFCSFKT